VRIVRPDTQDGAVEISSPERDRDEKTFDEKIFDERMFDEKMLDGKTSDEKIDGTGRSGTILFHVRSCDAPGRRLDDRHPGALLRGFRP
jgi:hypothetical protein